MGPRKPEGKDHPSNFESYTENTRSAIIKVLHGNLLTRSAVGPRKPEGKDHPSNFESYTEYTRSAIIKVPTRGHGNPGEKTSLETLNHALKTLEAFDTVYHRILFRKF